MIEEFAERVVKGQMKKPLLFLLAFAVITALLVPGIFRLVSHVEPSLEKVLPETIDEIETMNDMRAQFGADMMYLIVFARQPVADVREPDLLKYVDTLSQELRTRETILEVTNAADLVKLSNNGIIPESLAETKELLAKSPMSSNYLDDDFSFTVIRIRTDTGASASVIRQTVEDIDTDIAAVEEFNPGSEIQLTGFNAIDKATFEVIMSDFAFITLVSMVFVMIVVLVTFRSFVKGMLPMAVVMVALVWTMGITGYLGLTITVVTMVAAAMIMGLGIDFGIHVVHNYFNLRKQKSKRHSLIETMKELLRAMTGASLTTMAGFLALLFGVLPAMKTLGIVLALGIFTTLLSAVFLLPVLVYLYDRNIGGS